MSRYVAIMFFSVAASSRLQPQSTAGHMRESSGQASFIPCCKLAAASLVTAIEQSGDLRLRLYGGRCAQTEMPPTPAGLDVHLVNSVLAPPTSLSGEVLCEFVCVMRGAMTS